MAWRNPLFFKKRGRRSTGMRNVGHWSELLLSVSLVVMGGVTLGLHVFQVLVPDWNESRAPRGWEPGMCRVTELEIREKENPLSVGEFSIAIQAARITDTGTLQPPVWLDREIGNFSPTRNDALHMAEPYKPGTEHPCWFDPAAPNHLILRRPMRWWVWPVTLIPASLFAVGIFGIVASLMQVSTSAERRSLVSVKAMRLDASRESSSDSRHLTVPPIDDESPGVRFAHRLPALGTAGWRMAGLMIACAFWNVLLAYFVYVASLEYLRGNSPWLVLGLVVMLGLVGVWLAFTLIREFWHRRGIGQTHVEVSEHPLTLGGTYRGYLMQTGRMVVRSLTVELVCEELAIYQQGTDTRTSTEVVCRQSVQKWRHIEVDPTGLFESEFEFTIPADGMHSFRTPHNEIRWMLLVRGDTMKGQPIFRQFMLNVRPSAIHNEGRVLAASEIAGAGDKT
jgi:hypothetical protein